MQVLVDAAELKRMQRIARARGLTLAGWVRAALREATRQVPDKSAERKFAHLRAALRHDFPAPDVEEMLADIERGYDG